MKKAHQATQNHQLRNTRIAMKLSQQQMADLVGTTPVNISRWERGNTIPGYYFRHRLCEIFQCDERQLGFLLSKEDRSEPEATLSSTSLPSLLLTNSSIPYRRNPFFTGRTDILDTLHERLQSSPQAICGLGGVGKTQLALEYSFRSQAYYTAIFWVRAETTHSLQTDVLTIAQHLVLFEQQQEEKNQIILNNFKRWLSEHEGWLLVIDNVEQPAIVEQILPLQIHGHLLLTTQSQSLGFIANPIYLEKWSEDEGVSFLLHRARLLSPGTKTAEAASNVHTEEARQLVITLDAHPLALDQVGAYIEETGCSLRHYQSLYQSQHDNLLAIRGNHGGNHPQSVQTTLTLSCMRVAEKNPMAFRLLQLCAFLYPEHILESMLRIGCAILDDEFQRLHTNPLIWDQAIADLRRFSLLRRDMHTQSLTLHRLVQIVLRSQMAPETTRSWEEKTVHLINHSFPDTRQLTTWAECQAYLPQVQACVERIREHKLYIVESILLLNKLSRYLVEMALYQQAQDAISNAFTILEHLKITDDTIIAQCQTTQARVFFGLEEYEKSEHLHLQALATWERTQGTNNSDVAHCLNNLARIYHEQEKYEQAITFHGRALSIWETMNGSEHHTVALSLNNLAGVYHDLEEFEQAEYFYKKAHTIREKLLGPEHPHVATSLNNLGRLYQDTARYKEAESLLLRALAIRKKVLQEKHPLIGVSLYNLARLYKLQKKSYEAEDFYKQSAALWGQSFPTNHPYMLATNCEIAQIYDQQQRYIEAELLYKQVLEIQQQKTGPEHIDVARTLYYLARHYQAREMLMRAVEFYRKALAIQECRLKHNHPHIKDTRQSLCKLLEIIDQPL